MRMAEAEVEWNVLNGRGRHEKHGGGGNGGGGGERDERAAWP